MSLHPCKPRPLGAFLRPLGAFLRPLGAFLRPLGAFLRPLGAFLRLAPALRKRFGDLQPDQGIAESPQLL
ncbi:hypothetical protein V5M86_003126 [Enterobacter hormaechei]